MTTVSARKRLLRLAATLVATTAIVLAVVPWAGASAAEADESLVMISATSLTAGQTDQSFTMTVINTGADAVDATVAGSAPAGVLVAASASHGSYAIRSGLWAIGRLASGASATLVLTAL